MTNIRATRSQLANLNVKPTKKRGQNFVIDSSVITAILEFGNPLDSEDILEIGPGLGALTEGLRDGESLTLIEIEPEFCKNLRERFPEVTIINQDARTVDLRQLGKKFTVFGNLPYVYSTDILFHLLDMREVVTRAVFLLQREFSERVASAPGVRAYGILSVMTQVLATVRLGPVIPGDKFFPAAAVESRVLEITMRPEPLVPVGDLPWFSKVVKAAFHQKRKQIHNSLRSSGLFDVEQVRIGLEAANIDPSRRAETCSIEEFYQLAHSLER